MSAATTLSAKSGAWPSLRLRWPPGTTVFIAKTWLALAIAFYAAFVLELAGASSCGICVLILAQPTQGMVLSKAIYRIGGTLVGVVAAMLISAAFPQDRTMLIASFAIWIGAMTAVATLLRDFRAYGCVLAGYTVAIVSISNIDAANATFSAAINRVAAILVGVAAITLANILLSSADATRSLAAKLRAALTEVIGLAGTAMDDHRHLDAEAFVAMAGRLTALRSEIGFALPEKPNGRARAAGARSALLGLFESISAIQAVAVGLATVGPVSPAGAAAMALTKRAIHRQRPEACLPAFDDATVAALRAGAMPVEDAFLLDRLRFLITTIGDVRDGMRSLRLGRWPRRSAALPVHHDRVAVVLNATRVIVAIAIVAVLSIWSNQPDTTAALIFTAVFVSLGSLQPDPRGMGNAGLFGMPIVALLGALYAFFVFPNIEGYPLFILSLLPLVALMCWLVMIGQPGYGLIIGVLTMAQIAPANVQTLDPSSFVASASMLVPSGVAIFMAFRLVLPVQPAQRRLRLALGVGASLRNALADADRRTQPRAGLHYDRLSQFMTWQRGAPVTLARRRTMERLIDLGFLAYALRRSWRALDRARACVPPDLDTRARQVLPTLSPEETDGLARAYLGHAAGQDGPEALALVHAAAALHGTALATNNQTRLLRRIGLLHRRLGRRRT